MSLTRLLSFSAALLVGLPACSGGDGSGMQQPSDPCSPEQDPGSSLSCDVQPIFTANCALSGCHAGTSPAEGQNLSAGQAFASIVNVPSNQVPRLFRVEPSDPDSSYLVIKVLGEAAQVGGTDTRMPLGLDPLSAAQIDTIRSWIAAGALNN